jgi:4-hydroxy-3-polyprenylbenzoate decarboxylase
MKEVIALLKQHDELRIIDEPLDINLEIPHIAYLEVKKTDGKAILFTQPIDKAGDKKFDEPVLMNLFASFARTKLLLNSDIESIADEISDLLQMKAAKGIRAKLKMAKKMISLKRVFPKKSKEKHPPCQEVITTGDEVNLYDLPVITTWDGDGGPFITMGQVYTQSLDGELVNLGMYRLQVYDNKRLGMHWQIHKDASHFFDQYQRAGKKMPVSVAIGGDPLYTWCATAPLPYGMNELLMYGFIKGKPAVTVQSKTTPLWIPRDVDYVIEGWVDPTELKIEGPFGDHTGYYTLEEHYPVMDVTAITKKKEPTYLATVVGKPPIEDKYMGWATERIFLPLLKTTAPDLIDYHMPENGCFHNFIMAKMKPMYKGHAKQFMHNFWGQGQMSFVKHAIFVNDDAPRLTNYRVMSDYILDRIDPKKILITEGVCDALDHASPETLVGGKLGIDCTTGVTQQAAPTVLSDEELLGKIKALDKQVVDLVQYKTDRKNPVVVISVEKTESMLTLFSKLNPLSEHMRIVIVVDASCNDIHNPYMLLWRVTNNIDAQRDILTEPIICVDGTNKSTLDGYTREWPGDVNCDKEVLVDLAKRGLIDYDEELEKRFYLSS